MAISNYSELVAAVTNRINRSDITADVDNFIALAEARITRDLKGSELHLTTTLTADAQTEALPDDFAGLVRIHAGGTYPTLDYVPPDTFHSIYASSSTGRPIAYTIEGNNILFAPAPDTAYTITYTYVQKPDLVTDLTNRLITVFPDVYFYATLAEAADHIEDNEKYVKYMARYEQAVQQVNRSDQYKGPLNMKLIGVP